MKQDSRTRIFFLITKSNWGGAQQYVFDTASGLPDTYAPTVLFGGTGSPFSTTGALDTKLRTHNIPVMHIPALGRDVKFIADVRAFLHLVRILKKERPAILHLNSSKAGGLGALAGRIAGVKHIVFTSHGLAYDEDRSLVVRLFIFLASWLTFALCHRVICISQDTFERARGLLFVGRKMRFVRNGAPVFPLMPRDEARARLIALNPALQKDTVWIGAIAELTRNKGLTFAIDAYAALPSRERIACVVIGEGEEKKNLEKQIADAHIETSFLLAGFIPDARELLSAFDIFILPSIKEGLPYSLLEAGRARLAVVATDTSGVGEIVEHNTTGLLVPTHDSDALLKALSRLTQDDALRTRLGDALYEKVSTQFSPEESLKGTIAVYAEGTTPRR